MKCQFIKKFSKTIVLSLFIFSVVLCNGSYTYASTYEEYRAAAEERKNLPIQTDEIEGWPAGPHIGAESALLMEANTGAILYAKNIDEELYPASVTKLLTALVAIDECDMDEMVTFSQDAISSIDWKQDANMGINAGNSITMEQCLYGLLVGSANEVAYAIAEHICGDGNIEDFAALMNEKAASLGCTHSNFVTPNGIHDENHYTTAHDLGLIGQAFFSNELLCKMSSTTSYQIPQSPTQPKDDMIVWAKSKLHQGKEYAYPDLVGTKTGYTDYARQTLVSCAERNGLKLVCVIMKEESPAQFTDTVELFDFGFSNFQAVTVNDKDSTYTIKGLSFFSTDSDIFGSSKPILMMDENDYIVLPISAEFEDTVSELSYDTDENAIATVKYFFNDQLVGHVDIIPATESHATFDFSNVKVEKKEKTADDNVLVINVKNIIFCIVIIAVLLVAIFVIRSVVYNSSRSKRRKRVMKKYGKYSSLNWKDFHI